MEKLFNVKVDDSFEFDLKNTATEKLDFIKLSNTKYHAIVNNNSVAIEIIKADFNNKEYILKINADTHLIKISDELDMLIKKMGFSIGSAKKTDNVKAPMPGLILSINVEEGQEVKEGDTLLILEAMKMENSICAPKDGSIESIKITAGNTVEKGELLIKMA